MRWSWHDEVSSISRLPFYPQITFCFISPEEKKDAKINFAEVDRSLDDVNYSGSWKIIFFVYDTLIS